MKRLPMTVCAVPLALLCVLIFIAPATAQFETRSSTRLAHEPCGIAAADFRNDGTQDLAVALASNEIQVLLGNGDGTFQKPVSYTAGDGVEDVATGVLTSSGNIDIVVANQLSNFVSLLLGNGDGTFQRARSFATPDKPSFATIGDFNGDGIPDILVVAAKHIVVLLGNGDGTFKTVNTNLTYSAFAAGVGDFDGDGILDLAVNAALGGTNALVVLLGNGDGTFRQEASYQFLAPIGEPVVADLRGNGNLDLAVPGVLVGSVIILLGNGDGTFAAPVSYYPSSFVAGVVAGDFNGDGRQDVVAVDGLPSGVSLLLGNGDGTFQTPTFYPAGKDACYAVVADLNGDRQPDLAVTDDDGDAVITLLNTGVVGFSPTTPIAFPDQLLGTASAPQAITLTNSGVSTLNISSITASAQYSVSSACGKSVAPGANCALNVTFSPTAQGTSPGTISINDSASSKPQVIEVSGAGTVVTLSPPALAFGAQKVGTTSAPQQAQLTNTGAIAMSITKMVLHGFNPYDFSETSNCPPSLNAGASCTITVTFTPLHAGARSSILYVTDTGGGSPQTVSLSGTATT